MQSLYKYLCFTLPRLRFLTCAKGQLYLDFGCGDGVALRQNLVVRSDLKCFAIDVKDFSGELPNKHVSFSIYNGEKIPHQDNYFDIITVNHVLEHIQNPEKILTELKRVIKNKGRIYIEVPNKRSLWGKPHGKFAGSVHFFDDPTHLRPYSQIELTELCRQSGFRIIKSGIARNFLHLILSPILLFTGTLMPDMLHYMYARNSLIGWASYIILEK